MIIGISGKKQHGKNLVAKIINYLIEYPNSLNMTDNKENRSFNSFVMDMGMGHTTKFEEKSFAYKIKQIVALLLGITVQEVERMKEAGEYLPEEWDRYITYGTKRNIYAEPIKSMPHIPRERLTMRKFLQEIGTDAMRDVIHPNIWVNALMADYKPISEPKGDKHYVKKSVPVQYREGPLGLRHYTPNDNTIPEQYRNMVIDGSPTATWFEESNEPVMPDWIITDVRFPNEVEAIRKKDGLIIRINRPGMDDNDEHESETALDHYTNFDGVLDNSKDIQYLIDGVRTVLLQYKLI